MLISLKTRLPEKSWGGLIINDREPDKCLVSEEEYERNRMKENFSSSGCAEAKLVQTSERA